MRFEIDLDDDEVNFVVNTHAVLHAGSAVAAHIKDQIIQQMRIPEPGLWGVVEAECFPAASTRFYIHGPTGWREATGAAAGVFNWNRLVSPVLVHLGIDD